MRRPLSVALGPGADPTGKTLPPVKLPTPRMFRPKSRKNVSEPARIPEDKPVTLPVAQKGTKPGKEVTKKKAVRARAYEPGIVLRWPPPSACERCSPRRLLLASVAGLL